MRFNDETVSRWLDGEAPQPERCTYDPSTERYSQCDGHGRHHRTCPDAPKAQPPQLDLYAVDRLMHLAAHATVSVQHEDYVAALAAELVRR